MTTLQRLHIYWVLWRMGVVQRRLRSHLLRTDLIAVLDLVAIILWVVWVLSEHPAPGR